MGSLGSVHSWFHDSKRKKMLTFNRLVIFSIGYYYPLFYIQLNGHKHGITPRINFYIVRRWEFGCAKALDSCYWFSACHSECVQLPRTTQSWIPRKQSRGTKFNHHGHVWVLRCDVRDDWREICRQFHCDRYPVWILRGDVYVMFLSETFPTVLNRFSQVISLANPLLAGFATDQIEVGYVAQTSPIVQSSHVSSCSARMGIGFTLSGIGALVGAKRFLLLECPDRS